VDVIICDTAGRLHTAYELMEELEVREGVNEGRPVQWHPLDSTHAVLKSILQACKAAISKSLGPNQPDETLLVLDGTTGGGILYHKWPSRCFCCYQPSLNIQALGGAMHTITSG
jgi:fused signal recognition particle receptor